MEKDDACNSQTPVAILLAILLCWGVFIAIAAFFGTKSTWYDTWKTPEQIDFWVAVGTLVLAFFTASSVAITARVLDDEQVRHQQGSAPLVVFTLTTPLLHGVYLINLGKGLALNVTARFSIEFHPTIEPPPGSTFSEEYGAPEPSVSTLKESYDFKVFVSVAIDESGRPRRVEDEGLKRRQVLNNPVFKSAVIEYDDMFGNRYKTCYEPGSTTVFQWIRPARLRFQKGRDRDSDVAGDKLIEPLAG